MPIAFGSSLINFVAMMVLATRAYTVLREQCMEQGSEQGSTMLQVERLRHKQHAPADLIERISLGVPNAKPSSAPTFAVVSRIILMELPYAGSFLKHYASLGVQTFYLQNNHPDEHAPIAAHLRSFSVPGADVVLRSNAELEDANVVLRSRSRELIQQVVEDFMISVDIDEFWVLPEKLPSLMSLVQAHPADRYQIPWVMVVNDHIDKPLRAPYQGASGNEGKWMMKTRMVWSLHIHYPTVDHKYEHRQVKLKNATTVGIMTHFWGRSFMDQVSKGLAQQGMAQGKGCEGREKTLALVEEGHLPARLRLLAFMSNLPKDVPVNVATDLLVVDSELEKNITASLLEVSLDETKRVIQEMHILYSGFKDRLGETMASTTYPAYPGHSLTQISQWLAEFEEGKNSGWPASRWVWRKLNP